MNLLVRKRRWRFHLDIICSDIVSEHKTKLIMESWEYLVSLVPLSSPLFSPLSSRHLSSPLPLPFQVETVIDSVPMIFSQGENPCDGDDDDGDDGDDDVVCENSCDETSSHQSISYNIELRPFLDMVVILDMNETDASNRTVGVDRMDSHYNEVSERVHNKMDIHDDYDDGDDGGGDVYGSDEDSQDSHDC